MPLSLDLAWRFKSLIYEQLDIDYKGTINLTALVVKEDFFLPELLILASN